MLPDWIFTFGDDSFDPELQLSELDHLPDEVVLVPAGGGTGSAGPGQEIESWLKQGHFVPFFNRATDRNRMPNKTKSTGL